MTVMLISRGRGQSAVAAAAYRSGSTLRDGRYGITHRYAGRRGIAHAEILAPDDAPPWTRDRETLWNAVEAAETRKDAQLARLIEVSLPVELSADERLALLRDYIARELIAKGMIADLSMRGESRNPHAHIMLTLRPVTATGFGPKERCWNSRSTLVQWRSAWAARVNEHLARAGHAVMIDHRTLEAQQIELSPGRRVGISRTRRADQALPGHIAERIAEQQRIARVNGETILEDPTVALRALTHQRRIFSREDLAQFLRSRTGDVAQFDAAMNAVLRCPDCVALDPADGLEGRFSYRGLIEAQASLLRRVTSMAARRGHGVAPAPQVARAPGVAVAPNGASTAPSAMSDAERRVLGYVLDEGDAKALTLREEQKPAVLAAAHAAWRAAGFETVAAANSEHLAGAVEAACGIRALSADQWEERWQRREDELSKQTVLVIDGGQMIGLKQLERLVAAADRARGKMVLIADAGSLAAMKAEPPFLALWRRIGPPSDDAGSVA